MKYVVPMTMCVNYGSTYRLNHLLSVFSDDYGRNV